jgi:hypothetical protein
MGTRFPEHPKFPDLKITPESRQPAKSPTGVINLLKFDIPTSVWKDRQLVPATITVEAVAVPAARVPDLSTVHPIIVAKTAHAGPDEEMSLHEVATFVLDWAVATLDAAGCVVTVAAALGGGVALTVVLSTEELDSAV